MRMWTVKSESGTLRSVLVHSAGLSQWWKIPIPGTHPLTSHRTLKQTYPYEEAVAEHGRIIDFLSGEGVRVFELNRVLDEVVEGASLGERAEIIDEVWGEKEPRPSADDLEAEHLVYGYPPRPLYDEERDEFVVSSGQRGSIYTRDISFMTPIGLVVSKMKYEGRWEQPKVARLAFERHPELREKVEIVCDVSGVEDEVDFSHAWIEGGDVLVVDEETVLCGVGQRSNLLGMRHVMERVFEGDTDEGIRTFCAVRIPGPLPCGGHLDVFLNFPDARKALVMPYVFGSELVPGFPKKKLLTKLSEKLISLPGLRSRLREGLRLANFEGSGMCDVYRRGGDGRPTKVSRRENVIDFLVEEDKVDPDGVVMVGGEPEGEKDVGHLVRALQEGLREAGNIVTIKPGLIIAYDRNAATNESLEDHGVRIRRLPTAHLDMLGGPHCMTMPLHRDAA